MNHLNDHVNRNANTNRYTSNRNTLTHTQALTNNEYIIISMCTRVSHHAHDWVNLNCEHGCRQTMLNIVNDCQITKLTGGLRS